MSSAFFSVLLDPFDVLSLDLAISFAERALLILNDVPAKGDIV